MPATILATVTPATRVKSVRRRAPVAKRRFRRQNIPDVPYLPNEIDIAQKNEQCAGKTRPSEETNPLPAFYASLRSRNAHGHLTRKCLCKFFKWKCRRLNRPKPRPTRCASLRNRNAHGHLTREVLRENLGQKCRGRNGAPWSNPGLTPTVRTPECGHSVWGTNTSQTLIGADILIITIRKYIYTYYTYYHIILYILYCMCYIY